MINNVSVMNIAFLIPGNECMLTKLDVLLKILGRTDRKKKAKTFNWHDGIKAKFHLTLKQIVPVFAATQNKYRPVNRGEVSP